MFRFSWLGLLLGFAAAPAHAAMPDHPSDRWVELAPPGRADHVIAYDAQHRRLIIFGGRVDGVLRSDVWVLTLGGQPRWDRIEPTGDVPQPRSGAAAAFDAECDRLVVFGGRDTSGRPLDDLWVLSLHGRAAWSPIVSAGDHPRGRWRATLTPDPERRDLVLYGGEWGYGRKLGDVWELSLPRLAWSRLTVSGTPPRERSAHSAVWCPDLGGILVFAGEVYGPLPDCDFCRRGQETAEIWLLRPGEHGSWTPLKATSDEGPCEMQGHVAAWDATAHRMLVFGGDNFWRYCQVSYSTVWSLSVPGLAWSRLAPKQPWPRTRPFAAACFDPTTRSLFVHGGSGSVSIGASYADTWRLSLDPEPTWTLLSPSRLRPPTLAACVMDQVEDRVVMDAGDQVWTYDPKTGDWSPLVVAGDAPPAHGGNVTVLDSKRHQLVIFGGALASPGHAPFDQVWTLALEDDPRWTRLTTRGTPPAPLYDAAIYDPVRDRLLVCTASADAIEERGVWELPFGSPDPPQWRQLPFPSDPIHQSMTSAAAAVYDSERDRMLNFGGGEPSIIDGWWTTNACWALALGDSPAWALLSPYQYPGGVTVPTPRVSAAGVYDAAGDRLLVFGGFPGGFIAYQIPDNAWSFDLGSGQWTQLRMETEPHPGWINAVAVYDPQRGATLVFQNDIVWALESGPHPRWRRPEPIVSGAPTPWPPAVLDLRGVLPNPSAGEMRVEFTLPDDAPAALEMWDVAGRQLWRQEVGPMGRGTHGMRVSPASPMPPGIYLLRLTRGGTSLTTKVVRVRE